jgi:hypothetical protein
MFGDLVREVDLITNHSISLRRKIYFLERIDKKVSGTEPAWM